MENEVTGTTVETVEVVEVIFQHKINDLVVVKSRTWPGINKLGGVGRIKARESVVSDDSISNIIYTVAYVLGGKEEGINDEYIKSASNTITPRERKQTTKYVEPIVENHSPKKRKAVPTKKTTVISSSVSSSMNTATNKNSKDTTSTKKKNQLSNSNTTTTKTTITSDTSTSTSDGPPTKKSLHNDGYVSATELYNPTFIPVDDTPDEVVVADHVYEIAVIIHHAATAKMAESGEDMILVQEVMDVIVPVGVDNGDTGDTDTQVKVEEDDAMYVITAELFEEAIQYLSVANKFMISGEINEDGRILILI